MHSIVCSVSAFYWPRILKCWFGLPKNEPLWIFGASLGFLSLPAFPVAKQTVNGLVRFNY